MTITLADMAVFLGFAIVSAILTKPEVPTDYMDLCESLLGLSPPSDQRWSNEMMVVTWYRQLLVMIF